MLKLTLIIASLSIASVQAATPRVDARQNRQDVRIEHGVANGSLSQRETHALDRQQDRIERAESRVEADGIVTRGERVYLHRRLDASSRTIFRAKHNRW